MTYVERLDRGEIPTDQPGFWVRVAEVEHKNPMAPLPDLTHQALPRYEGLDVDGLVRAKRGFGEVLTWPPAMALLLDQSLRMYPWLLNQHLDPPVPGAAALVAWIRELDPEAWSGRATRAEVDRREAALLQTLSQRRIPHYRAPFPERPDYAFLRADRRRPLINVDPVGAP